MILKADAIAFAGAPIELKLASSGGSTIMGYGSTFGGEPDLGADVVAAGAFTATLAEHRSNGTMPAMFWAHDWAEVIGAWTDISQDAYGLKVVGQVNTDVQRGREALSLLKQKATTGLSIGFRVRPGGRKYDDNGIRVLTDVDLFEVSLVAIPANRRARVTSVKSLDTPQDCERFLTKAGLSDGAARKLTAGGFKALAGKPSLNLDTIAARLDSAIVDLKSLRK